jgi:hypothetical protein
MYVDKKLDGVKAVQTLSRLNRKHPGKDDTFVLDFVNTAEVMADAFAPYFERTWSQPTDPNILSNLKTRLLGSGVLDSEEIGQPGRRVPGQHRRHQRGALRADRRGRRTLARLGRGRPGELPHRAA